MNKVAQLVTVMVGLMVLQACTVVKVVDVAASTTIGVAKGTVKATGAVVDAAIPDGDDEDEDDD